MRRVPLLAVVLAAALGAGASAPPAAGPIDLAPAVRDSVLAAIAKDRADTDTFLRTNPQSALGAIARVDFGTPRRALVVGSAATGDLVLDDPSVRSQHVRIEVAGDSFRVVALDPGATFRAFAAGGRDTTAAMLAPSWIGIGRYRIRLSHQNAPALIAVDPDLPAKAAFPGSTWFPPDLAWRYVCALERDATPDTVRIESTASAPRASLRVGWFRFRVGGKEQKLAAHRLLEPGVGENDLSILFRDATTGKESYGLGRYLDPEPRGDGTWVLDFNLAYDPTCAISPYYNCPVPPPENRLDVAIRAGQATPGHAK